MTPVNPAYYDFSTAHPSSPKLPVVNACSRSRAHCWLLSTRLLVKHSAIPCNTAPAPPNSQCSQCLFIHFPSTYSDAHSPHYSSHKSRSCLSPLLLVSESEDYR